MLEHTKFEVPHVRDSGIITNVLRFAKYATMLQPNEQCKAGTGMRFIVGLQIPIMKGGRRGLSFAHLYHARATTNLHALNRLLTQLLRRS